VKRWAIVILVAAAGVSLRAAETAAKGPPARTMRPRQVVLLERFFTHPSDLQVLQTYGMGRGIGLAAVFLHPRRPWQVEFSLRHTELASEIAFLGRLRTDTITLGVGCRIAEFRRPVWIGLTLAAGAGGVRVAETTVPTLLLDPGPAGGRTRASRLLPEYSVELDMTVRIARWIGLVGRFGARHATLPARETSFLQDVSVEGTHVGVAVAIFR